MPINKYLIDITDDEMIACQSCAQSRNENAIKHKQRTDLTAAFELTQKNLMAVMSELAVAKYFGVSYTYPFIFQKNRSDVFNGVEVRATLHQNGNLIIYTYDKPAPYVLCIVNLETNTVMLVGWRDLVDCRLDKYWRTQPTVRKDSYWIPQNDLHDMKSLKEKLVYA